MEQDPKRRKIGLPISIRLSSSSGPSPAAAPKAVKLIYLNFDLQLYIFSFLSIQDLRCMSVTNHYFLNLLMESRFLQLVVKPKNLSLTKLELHDLIRSYHSTRNLFGISFRYCEAIPQIDECIQMLPPSIDYVDLSYRQEVGQSTLRFLPRKISRLDIACCKLLDSGVIYLGAFNNLKTLDISNCSQLTNDALKSLPPSIRTLSMGSLSKITHDGILLLPKSMESLNITGCIGIENLQCLERFTSLKKLKMQFFRKIVNEDLVKLPSSLEWLSLSDCSLITEAGVAILNAPKLNTLDLSGCTAMSSLEGFQQLTALKELALALCEKIPNEALKNLPPNLKILSLFHCSQITDEGLDWIVNSPLMNSLAYLDLRYTKSTEDRIKTMRKTIKWVRLEASATSNAENGQNSSNHGSAVSTPEQASPRPPERAPSQSNQPNQPSSIQHQKPPSQHPPQQHSQPHAPQHEQQPSRSSHRPPSQSNSHQSHPPPHPPANQPPPPPHHAHSYEQRDQHSQGHHQSHHYDQRDQRDPRDQRDQRYQHHHRSDNHSDYYGQGRSHSSGQHYDYGHHDYPSQHHGHSQYHDRAPHYDRHYQSHAPHHDQHYHNSGHGHQGHQYQQHHHQERDRNYPPSNYPHHYPPSMPSGSPAGPPQHHHSSHHQK